MDYSTHYFFQFWANFVSSIFLFFALINVHYLFGTSNFYLLNFLLSIFTLGWHVPESFVLFSLVILLTGLFIKLGLSPYQFFKIETYKGIPLLMIVVYTTIYLVVYVYFFSYLYLHHISFMKTFTSPYVSVFIGLSVGYLVTLIFDAKNFKAFLSYSTLITVINLFMVILLS